MRVAYVLVALAVGGHRLRVPGYVDPRELPKVPAAVRMQLASRGCLIPLGADRTPAAVVGAFYEPGPKNDWAVYCSRSAKSRRRSTLFVFRASRSYAADSTGFVMRDRLEALPARHLPRGTPDRLATSLVTTGSTDLDMLFRPGADGSGRALARDELALPRHDGLLDQLDTMVLVYWSGRRWIVYTFEP